MRFFEGFFGSSPEQTEMKPATVEGAAMKVADELNRRASKAPNTRYGRFARGAALLGLLVAGEAAAGEREPTGNEYPSGVAVTAGGKSHLLNEKLAYFEEQLLKARRAERNAEVERVRLEHTHDKRMFGESLPVDTALMEAKMQERQAERKVDWLERRVEKTQSKLGDAAEDWTEHREEQEKTIDVFGAANSEMEEKMSEWGIVGRGNTIAVPMEPTNDGQPYKWITADEQFIGVGFYPNESELRIVFEKTDHTFNTVIIKYDKKLGQGIYSGMIVSDREGNPVK